MLGRIPVDEQKAELRQYKKKLKAQGAQVELVPLTIELKRISPRGRETGQTMPELISA